MKAFIIVWLIVQLVLLFIGTIWQFIDRKRGKFRNAPYIIGAIGCFMMVIYFLILKPMLENSFEIYGHSQERWIYNQSKCLHDFLLLILDIFATSAISNLKSKTSNLKSKNILVLLCIPHGICYLSSINSKQIAPQK